MQVLPRVQDWLFPSPLLCWWALVPWPGPHRRAGAWRVRDLTSGKKAVAPHSNFPTTPPSHLLPGERLHLRGGGESPSVPWEPSSYRMIKTWNTQRAHLIAFGDGKVAPGTDFMFRGLKQLTLIDIDWPLTRRHARVSKTEVSKVKPKGAAIQTWQEASHMCEVRDTQTKTVLYQSSPNWKPFQSHAGF